jgi:quercetin dioxygenase-like cupin family protein
MADLQTLSGAEVAFSQYDPNQAEHPDGALAALDAEFPTVLRAFGRYRSLELPDTGTHFGYVREGTVRFAIDGTAFLLTQGFYFAIPGAAQLSLIGPSAGIVITRLNYRGFFHVGKIEHRGRLRYIDGCTDSLLIPPVKRGDPCLNLLYFPPGIDQTMHTHPSVRAGVILSGVGECATEDQHGARLTALTPGLIFAIHAGGRHKFRTHAGDMRVLAYHPDTDFGPTDEDHPMLNRTFVGGISARELPEIHTR